MGESGKAVFLSYASQDAAAAGRICEALRAAGVEVWFDQNELVGGDAWDAKIRKQIAECALFVPIVSANTQARLEGYFRIEWKLAAQRTHAMADEKAFLLPVVIDETRDAEAKVPAEFKAVQWTRLPGGETPARFCERVKTLLGGDVAGVVDPGPASARPATNRPPTRPRRWIAPLAAALVMAATLFVSRPGLKTSSTTETAKAAAAKDAPALPPTETQKLLARVWELVLQTDFSRGELLTAHDMCKRASELSPLDADVWAAWTYVDTWLIFFRLDDVARRRALADDHAARAIRLAPNSYEARLAQAFFWVRGRGGNTKRAEADALLRQLLVERPDEPRAMFALGMNLGGEEGNALLEKLAQNPRFTAIALNEIAWRVVQAGQFTRAEEVVDRSIAAYPYWHNLTLKMIIATDWHGDLEAARAVFARVPVARAHEDWMVNAAVRLHLLRRDPKSALAALDAFPREWIDCHAYTGPKAFHLARARLAAGQVEPAQREARKAVALIDQRLAESPNDPALLGQKALMLDVLGERAEAEKTYRLLRDVRTSGGWSSWGSEARYELTLRFESVDDVLSGLEDRASRRVTILGLSQTAALLRLHPEFDPLRANPRFQALLARTEADSKWSPKAAPGGGRKPEDGGKKE